MYLIKFKDQENVKAILQLLVLILQEHDIFQKVTEPTAFDAVEASLSLLDFQALDTVIPFFDDCCMRCVRKPIKYHDDLDGIIKASQVIQKKPVSAIWAAIIEQWPFAQNSDPRESIIVASWISTYLALCCHIGEDKQVLLSIAEALAGSTINSELRKALQAQFSHQRSQLPENLLRGFRQQVNLEPLSVPQHTKSEVSSETHPYFLPVQSEENNYQYLGRVHEDVEQSITTGALGELILYLCAKHVEIRKEALVNIRKVRHELKVRFGRYSMKT